MTSDSGSGSKRLAGARLLDRGAAAEIYEWADGRVLRLLPVEAPIGRVEHEASVTRAAITAGVPVRHGYPRPAWGQR